MLRERQRSCQCFKAFKIMSDGTPIQCKCKCGVPAGEVGEVGLCVCPTKVVNVLELMRHFV